MSIIHDALKKTGGALQTPQANPPDAPSPEVASYLKKKRRVNRIKWAIFCVLAASLGLYIGNIPFGLLDKARTLVARKQAEPEALQKKDASPLKNIPFLPAAKKESDAFVLNGIFSSEDGGYVLINNQILKVGEVVNGATVREIGKNEVTLQVRGRLFKLSTR